jgi:hypothetical protein
MQQEPALPFDADSECVCVWLQDSTYLFSMHSRETNPISISDCELTFTIKELSAIWGKHSSTVHQLLKRPENWSSHNIASKNKCGKEIQVTLKFQ